MSSDVALTDLRNKCAPAKILAVSKLQSIDKIRALYRLGQRDFGENYVQEITAKMTELSDLKELRWHFIGSLQRNKAKQIVGKVELIHSVDSLSLAATLSKLAVKSSVQQKILLQVNIADEESKSGFPLEELKKSWPSLCQMPSLAICGLMTMPPLEEDTEKVRPYFKMLKQLQEFLKTSTPSQHPLNELSMGTSGDFAVAIQEGATIVRLGTILFGERHAKR